MSASIIDERLAALGDFKLIAGVGSENSKEACAMTLLAWICGEKWTDHPPCTHRLIADTVIRANDANETTPEMRRQLVELGKDGALDTWWVPHEVVVWALAGEDQAPFAAATRMLENVAAWKRSKERPDLRGADLRDADLRGADLRDADLRGADLRDADLSDADLRDADLSDADLRDADLSGADLTGAWYAPYGGMPIGWKIENDRWVRA